MPTYRSDFAALLEPDIRKIYGDAYKDFPEEYSAIFNMETSKKKTETDVGLTGFGLVPEKPEGQAITYDTAFQGLEKQYTHLAYGMGFSVTREMFEDDLYRKIKGMPAGLARSVRHTIEILGANHLNRAFSNSYVGADGVELCSELHTTQAGGTYRNELDVAADLDITSYEQMLVDIHTQFIDDRGLKLAVQPKCMIIHPSNIFQAEQILKSAQLPGTANNDYNPAQGTMPGGFKVMHWLTDEDAWFVLTDVPNGLNWFWRRTPEFTKDNDWETENAKFKTTFRCSSGWTDPRGIFGSPGI